MLVVKNFDLSHSHTPDQSVGVVHAAYRLLPATLLKRHLLLPRESLRLGKLRGGYLLRQCVQCICV